MVRVLVISGGGLWATAGIGVAHALRELGIEVDGYVGSSAGALVAALLAAGHSPEVLEQAALSLNGKEIRLNWREWGSRALHGRAPLSLFSMKALATRLEPFLEDLRWSALRFPLWVTATSLRRYQTIVYGTEEPRRPELSEAFHLAWGGQTLDLQRALAASAAVPALFPPVETTDDVLVDGGVVDDYPVDVAAWVGANRIVGVWVDEKVDHPPSHRVNGGNVAMMALTTMIRELTVIRQRHVDVSHIDVRIEISGGHRVFEHVADIIRTGYAETWARADQIRAGIDRRAE
ncbi:MAG: hypothetical protein C7B45_04065 [Sulfobacillus acidophilus]|uniref:PNPLA domain-containing protein n=1 Tax=Sulfobacillus acidophilus TaxID=53633 RepID=A0A2T2WLM2_9FIRM|nr:MAG: hypothetical protein C7B45_04065 [Sulfobacillus acidophilus]